MKKNEFHHSQKSIQEISIETTSRSKCLKSIAFFCNFSGIKTVIINLFAPNLSQVILLLYHIVKF